MSVVTFIAASVAISLAIAASVENGFPASLRRAAYRYSRRAAADTAVRAGQDRRVGRTPRGERSRPLRLCRLAARVRAAPGLGPGPTDRRPRCWVTPGR